MFQISIEKVKFQNFILVLTVLLGDANSKNSRFKEVMQPRLTTMCDARNLPGLICESCNSLAYCVKIGGSWQTYPVEHCDAGIGEYCNIHEGKCSRSPGPCNRIGYEGNFPCTSDGIFPDPYDCQIYHMCYQAEPGEHIYLPIAGTAKCEGRRAYSVSTSDCTATLLDDICKTKQYTCNTPGETNAWPGNPNIFYICQPGIKEEAVLYPTLYRCGPGEIFSNSICTNSTNPTRFTHNTGKIKSTTEGGEHNEAECNRVGLQYDPNDCTAYFYCDNSKKAQHKKCPNKTYFNSNTQSCVFGSCTN